MFLIGKGLKVKNITLHDLLASMSSQYRCYDTPSAAASYDLGQAVGLDKSLNNTNMVHTHDGSSTQQKSTSPDCVPDLPKKLYFFALRNVGPDDDLEVCCQLSLVLLDQSLRPVVCVSVQERRVVVGNVSVTVRADYLYKLHSIFLGSCLAHAPHQLLEILVVIVRRVDLVGLLLDDRQLVVDFGYCFPLFIGRRFAHDSFESCHFLAILE